MARWLATAQAILLLGLCTLCVCDSARRRTQPTLDPMKEAMFTGQRLRLTQEQMKCSTKQPCSKYDDNSDSPEACISLGCCWNGEKCVEGTSKAAQASAVAAPSSGGSGKHDIHPSEALEAPGAPPDPKDKACTADWGGTCVAQTDCDGKTSRVLKNTCVSDPTHVCCVPVREGTPDPKENDDKGELCGAYAGKPIGKVKANGKKLKVVHILSQHRHQTMQSDTVMALDLACAFDKLHEAGRAKGHEILITSGLRSDRRQKEMWEASQCTRVSDTKTECQGPIMAVPGQSQHGRGNALDLNTSDDAGIYKFLLGWGVANGWKQPIDDQPWHWQFVGQAAPAPAPAAAPET